MRGLLNFQFCCVCWTVLEMLWHLAKASTNLVSRRATVITLCIMCATQGICLYGSILAAAIILRALSVLMVVNWWSNLPLLCNFNKLAHASAKYLSSIFTRPKGQLPFVIEVYRCTKVVMVAYWCPVASSQCNTFSLCQFLHFLWLFTAMQYVNSRDNSSPRRWLVWWVTWVDLDNVL